MRKSSLKIKGFKRPFGGRVVLFAIAFAALLAVFGGFSSASQAQTRDFTSYLPLHDDRDSYNFTGHMYVTRNPGRTLNFDNYKQFMERHLAGKNGSPVSGPIVNLGGDDVPHWIVLAVNNQSWNEKWVLSLGDHLSGRLGLFDNLFVYDHLSKKTYVNSLKTSDSPYVKKDVLSGNTVTLEIPRGQKALIFLYVVPNPGFPATLAPQLMTQNAYIKQSASVFNQGFLVNAFFVMMIGVFLATILFRQMWSGIIFVGYYAVLLALLRYHNEVVQADFSFASRVPGVLFNLFVICGLLMTKNFLGIGRLQQFQSQLIITIMAGLLVSSLFALFVIPPGMSIQLFVMYGPPVAAVLFATLLCLAFGYSERKEGYQLAVGWGAVLIGLCSTAVSLSNIFAPSLWAINGFWYGLVIQGVFLISAITTRLIIEDRAQQLSVKEQQAESESVARITASKESSENARLLRMIDHERQVMNELREREVQQNEEMRKAKEDADLANNAKSAFLAVVSHEIRTPMTGIMGMVRLLQETKLSQEQRQYSQTIQDSGEAMMALLNDILDFEKIESDKMDLEHIDFDLHRLIQGVKTLMSGHAEAKKIYLKVNMDPAVPRFVIGDPVRLRQVILNLTGNSIKFTGEGGVTIHVKPDTSGGKGVSRIRFAIEDTGVGITKEAQKNLFNPFTQADSAIARKFGGTGLGLAISQKLIEAMGGAIEIDSTEGHGSTFFFTVTMEEGSAEAVESAAAAGSIQATAKPAKALRILIVEDNEINQKLMKELIDRMGHETKIAGSGEEAMKVIADRDFDMVLMDIELPGMTGMGTTKAIRALDDRKKAALPVIAMTGNVRDEDVRQCYAANMNGHIAKPIDPKRLKDQIAKVTDNKLDNPVELFEEKRDQHTRVTQLSVGDEQFGAGAVKSIMIEEDEPVAEPEAKETALDQTFDDASLEEGGFDGDFEEEGDAPFVAAAAEDDVAPIRALAMEASGPGSIDLSSLDISEDELDEDTFETALIRDSNSATTMEIFDFAMLESLRSTVGNERLDDLIRDMLEKADELVGAIADASARADVDVLAARAHELKGMAGNFGLVEIRNLAAEAELAAKDQENGGHKAALIDLHAAQSRARAALQEWMSAG